MHGVPSDLPVQEFVGSELVWIRIGQYQIEFQFDAPAIISVEGRWELQSGDGTTLDRDREPGSREAYRVHSVLQRRVVEAELDAPRSMSLRFDDGSVLTVIDDNPRYESFSVMLGQGPPYII